MWGSRGALSRGLIREDAESWWFERGFVKAECSVDLGVGRKIYMGVGFTKGVKGGYGVWDKVAPGVEEGGSINTVEAGNEVCFEGVDSFFCWIGAMVVGWSKLVFYVVTFKE